MIFFNPSKRADIIRPRIMKNGKYLIAKIEGSGQERKDKKVLDTYFRYKDYMDNKEWFSASMKEVWVTKVFRFS